MGRKKKGVRNQTPTAAVVTGAKGVQHDNKDATASAHHAHGTSKVSKKRRRSECNQFHPNKSISNDPPMSNWFSEVKWVSRHHHASHQTLQNDEASSVPAGTSGRGVKNLPKKTAPPLSPPNAIPPPVDPHDALLSELKQLKEQLMPAAKLCANAINKSQGENTTTPAYEFRQARSICNPYERLGETFSKNHSKRCKKMPRKRKYNHRHSSSGFSQFINRSAIKLANIDYILGFCLSSTAQSNRTHRNENPNFVFVDLCGGPGGFSEYLLYRHVNLAALPDNHEITNKNNGSKMCSEMVKQPCYGFGMTLSGSNDDGKGVPWDLDHLSHHHLHCNDTRETRNGNTNQKLCYHVCNGADGTGSIYNFDNVLQLQREICTTVPGNASSNRNPLANLVVADGGFDAQRDSSDQEAIAHKIVASQTAAALTLLRPGGVFVLKMFGFRKEETRRMLSYMYECFDRMTFVKPILSRPASAERYLVCHGYAGPEIGWDGFLWREEMIAPQASSRTDGSRGQKHAPLEELIDSFDMDMLQLNVDACASIINYLGKKSKQQGEYTSDNPKQKHYLDLKVYQAAWQLF